MCSNVLELQNLTPTSSQGPFNKLRHPLWHLGGRHGILYNSSASKIFAIFSLLNIVFQDVNALNNEVNPSRTWLPHLDFN